ncbi:MULTISPECIES: MerC domain-containing protein [Hymenobacter]|uniref:MerC family mercury resistance protein n=2 Tax=Hymenobacter TaxID=89966 RepID=A0ABS6WV44_9BACT|nr:MULTISPECIES: MerC domain-containing protein [Hymenobacter]MBO3270973.1 MerC domain-containing protein [Hymenobacter defluvii]MBW3127465.1 MerC family mercury resistance protein [Hymenobacter profundi]QNE39683.1 MerC domain-containing protein [Hymenobacter sp. NBH84]
MKPSLSRVWADYGGIVNATLCLLHCAAGPLLLAWWSGTQSAALSSHWDTLFLVLSGVLVMGATWQLTARWLRLSLWSCFALFAVTVLLADRWPWLELVQYAASLGLVGMHLLNLRQCRRCAVVPAPAAG